MTDIHDNWGYTLRVVSSEEYNTIVLGGDFLNAPDITLLWDFLRLIKEASGVPILFVPGNWEPIEILLWSSFGGAINLHATCFSLQYKFCGLGGTAPKQFFFPLEFDIEDIEYYIAKLQQFIGQTFSIFVSHMIPFEHPKLMRIIDEYKPRIALCGHIHEDRFVRRRDKTTIVNPGALYDGWYSIFDGDGNTKTKHIAQLTLKQDRTMASIPRLETIEALYKIDMAHAERKEAMATTYHDITMGMDDPILPILLYKNAIIDPANTEKITEKTGIIHHLIETGEPQALRWASRILGRLPNQQKQGYAEIIYEKTQKIENLTEAAITILTTQQNIEPTNTIQSLVLNLQKKIKQENTLENLFLLTANIALIDRPNLLDDIADIITSIMERETLEHIAIMLRGLSRYANYETLEKLATIIKNSIKKKIKQANKKEKTFFINNIENIQPKNSIFTMTLRPILKI